MRTGKRGKDSETEECVHEKRKRGQRGERQSVCEQGRDSFETRLSVAELSERCVSHGADET